MRSTCKPLCRAVSANGEGRWDPAIVRTIAGSGDRRRELDGKEKEVPARSVLVHRVLPE
jgi:hypothetical protein